MRLGSHKRYSYNFSHSCVVYPTTSHGLSYTTWDYSNLKASRTEVTADVRNNGTRVGSEVPQLYLSYPPSAGEPPRQLKGFQKVLLQPGESKTVSFPLSSRSFSVWDPALHNWTLADGSFDVMVGSSSQDIRLRSSLHISSSGEASDVPL